MAFVTKRSPVPWQKAIYWHAKRAAKSAVKVANCSAWIFQTTHNNAVIRNGAAPLLPPWQNPMIKSSGQSEETQNIIRHLSSSDIPKIIPKICAEINFQFDLHTKIVKKIKRILNFIHLVTWIRINVFVFTSECKIYKEFMKRCTSL